MNRRRRHMNRLGRAAFCTGYGCWKCTATWLVGEATWLVGEAVFPLFWWLIVVVGTSRAVGVGIRAAFCTAVYCRNTTGLTSL